MSPLSVTQCLVEKATIDKHEHKLELACKLMMSALQFMISCMMDFFL